MGNPSHSVGTMKMFPTRSHLWAQKENITTKIAQPSEFPLIARNLRRRCGSSLPCGRLRVRKAKEYGARMLIFWDQRLAFLATPKTGSTAIEVALEPLASVAMQRPESLKHLNSGQYRNHLAPLLAAQAGEAFTTIALMRDPLGWLRSWYRFYLRDELDEYAQELRARGFEAFARDYIEDHPSLRAVGTQSDFLTDLTGRPMVDRIFRYEQIEVFLHYLEDRLDCAITLPRVNVPPAVDVQLSQQTEADLRAAMNRDFLLYDSLG